MTLRRDPVLPVLGSLLTRSLSTYADYIGITYYLIAKLADDFPPEDVEFYWPQYW